MNMSILTSTSNNGTDGNAVISTSSTTFTTITMNPLLRVSRSLQYEQHHTQFYDPMITDFHHYFDSTTGNSYHHQYYEEEDGSHNNHSQFGGDGEYGGTGSIPESSNPTGGSDSIVIVCALFVPLIIAVSAILIIALLIRRMRRAESLSEIVDEEKGGGNSHFSNDSNFYHFSKQISTESIPEANYIGKSPSMPILNGNSSQINKKVIPLHVILGIEDLSTFHVEDETEPSSPSSPQPDLPDPKTTLAPVFSPPNNSLSTPEAVDKIGISVSMLSVVSSTNTINASTPDGKSPSVSSISHRMTHVLNFRKRMKEAAVEKNRFNIYTVPWETREQLKKIYVY